MTQAAGWECVMATGILQGPCPSKADTDCGSCLQDGLGAGVGAGALWVATQELRKERKVSP